MPPHIPVQPSLQTGPGYKHENPRRYETPLISLDYISSYSDIQLKSTQCLPALRILNMSSVPQEIIDIIVGELHGDSDTLKQCALVSRSFLAPCRMELFSVVHLESFHYYSTGLQFGRLYDALTSTPEISYCIRELCLKDLPMYGKMAVKFVLFLEGLPRLRLFCHRPVLGTDWRTLTPEVQSALLSVFKAPTLRAIMLSRVRNLPVAIFRSFARLERLALGYVLFDGRVEVSSIAPPRSPFPSHMQDPVRPAETIVPVLPTTLGVSRLRCLMLVDPWPDVTDALPYFLREACELLESFTYVYLNIKPATPRLSFSITPVARH